MRWTYERTATGEDVWNRCVTDANGNLVYDGKQFYQYDAWNRLIQVNDASAMRWWAFYPQGVKMGVPYIPNMAALPSFCETSVPGWLIKHYNYDGVGRLYRTSSPLTAPEGYIFNGSGVRANRSERFFYDGTRRVQELLTDPILVPAEQGEDVITMQQENQQTGGGMGSGGNGGGVGGETGGPATLNYCRAVYIWGPGDSPTSGVDELLVQIDPRDTGTGAVSAVGGRPWYAVNDAQGDLVALLHKQSTTSAVQIAAQWTYSPYGEVLTYEQFHPHPVVVFGHKSLVVDRLDAPALSWDTGTSSLSDTQRLMPGAKLIAYARNRTYSPGLGRWLQQDPNASGQAAVSALARLGTRNRWLPDDPNLGLRLMDGSSLLAYAKSNPTNNSDPTGLLVGLILPGPEDLVMAGFRALRGGLEEMIGQYGANQDLDLDWAMDWSQDDNFHSRMENGWVQESFNEGAWNAFIDEIDPTGGRWEDIITMGGVGSAAGKAAKAAKRLTGQLHHAISTKVHRALEKHKVLAGKYAKRDDNWITQAGKLDDHKGYQTWHRKYDGDVVKWLEVNKNATPEQFERYLKGLYRKGDLSRKFPHGLRKGKH